MWKQLYSRGTNDGSRGFMEVDDVAARRKMQARLHMYIYIYMYILYM